MVQLRFLRRRVARTHSGSAQRGAFTLIELLVVIAIIALLAAILFPVFSRARENARRSACMSNMKQLGLGVVQYLQDFDGYWPVQENSTIFDYMDTTGTSTGGSGGVPETMNLFSQIYPYVKNYQVYVCPSAVPFPDPAGCGASCYKPTSIDNTNYVTNGVLLRLFNDTNLFNQPVNESAIPSTSTTILLQEFGYATNAYLQRPRYNLLSPTGYQYWQGENLFDNVTCPNVTCLGDMHFDGGNILYADGHAKYQNVSNLTSGAFALTPSTDTFQNYQSSSSNGGKGIVSNASVGYGSAF